MQDRFKFRVWLEYAKLYYGFDSFYYDRPKNKYTFHFEDGHTKTIKEKDFVIEQCTGSKDKNGKLIYEGDIVTDGKEVGIIYWYKTGWAVTMFLWQHDTSELKVIGNIHENPELLEEKAE